MEAVKQNQMKIHELNKRVCEIKKKKISLDVSYSRIEIIEERINWRNKIIQPEQHRINKLKTNN